MKAMLVAIQPKWLKMILDGEKKFEFRNWKVPVGTVIYFYESLGVKREGRGKVVAKAVVEDVLFTDGYNCDSENGDDVIFYDKPYSHKKQIWLKLDKAKSIGFNVDDNQKYALELSQVEEIEPKEVTEFVSWNKLDKKRKKRNNQEDIRLALHYGDWQMEFDTVSKYVDYHGVSKGCYVKQPPQSRTWVYVE